MSVEQIMNVPENGQLTIQLPSHLKGSKKVKVVIDEVDESREAKIALLKQAANDPLFLADMKEVNEDFEGNESKLGE
jgi:hypothetical protein